MTIQDLYELYAEAERENRLIYDGLQRYKERISKQTDTVNKIEEVKEEIIEKARALGLAPDEVVDGFSKMIYNLGVYKDYLNDIKDTIDDISFLSLLE
jgi:hypothetical protein